MRHRSKQKDDSPLKIAQLSFDTHVNSGILLLQKPTTPMHLLNTNQSHSIPKKSSVSFIGGITDAFKSRSQNILSGYESLTRNKKQPVKHSTLERSAALSLDILNFEYFYIVKLGGKEEQFTLPNGELVVPCVFEYKYTDEAIIKKSIEKGHYYL